MTVHNLKNPLISHISLDNTSMKIVRMTLHIQWIHYYGDPISKHYIENIHDIGMSPLVYILKLPILDTSKTTKCSHLEVMTHSKFLIIFDENFSEFSDFRRTECRTLELQGKIYYRILGFCIENSTSHDRIV